jgi:hypothetical protein
MTWAVQSALGFALNAVVTFGLGTGGLLGARTNKQVSAAYPTLTTPAGWAFAIWGPIFALEAGAPRATRITLLQPQAARRILRRRRGYVMIGRRRHSVYRERRLAALRRARWRRPGRPGGGAAHADRIPGLVRHLRAASGGTLFPLPDPRVMPTKVLCHRCRHPFHAMEFPSVRGSE